MSQMIEVKTAELSGAALDYAWQKATGRKLTGTGKLIPNMARFVISIELGDTVAVPAELLP